MKYKLNEDLLKDMFISTVIGGREGEIHILFRKTSTEYFDLVNGTVGWFPHDLSVNNLDWVIYPGDICEVSDNEVDWHVRKFNCFSGDYVYSYEVASNHTWRYIRKYSELTERQIKEQELEATILKAQKELEELKQLD